MPAQGSSPAACANGIQSGASAKTAAADRPNIALFIRIFLPHPLMAADLLSIGSLIMEYVE
jgi:hypothetical protein